MSIANDKHSGGQAVGRCCVIDTQMRVYAPDPSARRRVERFDGLSVFVDSMVRVDRVKDASGDRPDGSYLFQRHGNVLPVAKGNLDRRGAVRCDRRAAQADYRLPVLHVAQVALAVKPKTICAHEKRQAGPHVRRLNFHFVPRPSSIGA